MQEWYLLRTKVGEGRNAQNQLQGVVERIRLPLAWRHFRQRGRPVERIAPLFPSYVLAFLSLSCTISRKIRYTRGVRDLVWLGEQLAWAQRWVIDQVMSRCSDGLIEMRRKPHLRG